MNNPNFCTECGKKLNNVITGIVIMKKGTRFRAVCRECVTMLLMDGWELAAVAKGLAPIVS